ncbi:sulfatase [Halobiforma lacisalsi AJ5]|uniref:Sulfatase n=1 Tax=Natronobacterium lacisalsi AJ5 TaxID=358396 RepID=M0LMM8_NATLA|nr:sulfatase [Halobiforma lacisalsi]APW98503.1 sulfatase [Halobiforma lacisalsi AJ5]EMA33285.1 sulfatase [Halobiforma lacisalsi AJ5]
MPADRPNVVLITCHDLGRYLGCYGADVETPRIDEFADRGALFENHFVTAPQCSPSRGSFMTGRHPHVNGLMGLAHGDWELDDGERILPHYLDDLGYETHLFGLQHITQDTDRLEYEYVHSEGNLYPGVSPDVHEANRARNVASVVSGFLEKAAFDAPFFAAVGFFELHRVEEENGRFGFDSDYYETDDPDEVRPLTYLPDRRGVRQDLAEMHGMVRAVDDAVGSILDALAETGLEEETLVVFTTEHGIAFPRAKGSCYDPGIEAALLLRYPGVADDGTRYDELVSNVDVLPTLLELVAWDGGDGGNDGGGDGNGNGDEKRDGTVVDDLERPDGLNGRSFLSLLTGDEYEPRERVFAGMTWHDMYNPVRAIRTEQYKYIRSFWHLPEVYLTKDVFASEAGRAVRESDAVPPRPYEELYDLEESPQENENVVFEPRYQDVREDLARQLHEWMAATDDPLLDGPVVPGDYGAITTWPYES